MLAFQLSLAWAQGTMPPDYQLDNEIIFRVTSFESCAEGTCDSNGENCVPACFQSCARIVLKGVATRVVGRGLLENGDLNAEGYLINPSHYVANGIVSDEGWLRFELWNGSGAHSGSIPKYHVSPVKVNGTAIKSFGVKYGKGSSATTKVSLKVPIGLIRFARRIPGGPPAPRENTIEIETAVTEPNTYISNECGDHDGFQFGVCYWRNGKKFCGLSEMRLEFEALSPIVMVHGMDSSRRWFTERGFKNAFDDVRAPYYLAPQDALPSGIPKPRQFRSDSFGDDRIRGAIPQRLVHEIERAAKEYGSDRVHIVAHSKGGLWSRAAIEHLAGSNPANRKVGIYSLTTIDTPHLGAVIADFSDYAENHLNITNKPKLSQLLVLGHQDSRSLFTQVWALLLSGKAKWTESVPDLRPSEVSKFNGVNKLPNRFEVRGVSNRVRYNVVGSDANLNGNYQVASDLGKIDHPLETVGWEPLANVVCPTLYESLQLYGDITWDNITGAITSVEYLRPPYDGNDFAVTLRSQFFLGSTAGVASKFDSAPYSWPQNPLKKNHTTVGDADIGSLVRGSFNIITQATLDR